MEEYKINVIAGTKLIADMVEAVKDATYDATIEIKPVPPGPLPDLSAGGVEKKMDVGAGVWTWKGVVLKNPLGTDGIPEGYNGSLWFDKVNWSISKMQELQVPQGVDVIDPVGDALPKEKAVALFVKSEVSTSKESIMSDILPLVKTRIVESSADDHHHFQDIDGALLAKIDKYGKLHAFAAKTLKEDVNYLVDLNIPGYLFAVLSATNQVIFGVREDGSIVPKTSEIAEFEGYYNAIPYEKFKGNLAIKTIKNVKDFIALPAIAIGRESAEGSGDAPKVPLTIGGYTHPSVLHIPSGWNGFEYWMAITPTFGIIAQQPDSGAYENPYIFCSNDGINWQEPVGITNPIDTPPHFPFSGYWSDTHLLLGDDGYMYCIYRGNSMPNKKIGITENPDTVLHSRVDVYKRSRDGIIWGDYKVITSSHATPGIDNNGGIMSPAFVQNGTQFHCYDVVWDTPAYPFTGDNQTKRVVMRRIAASLDAFMDTAYSQNNTINFLNRPWPADHSVWHLDALKWGNTWFILLNTSKADIDSGNDLYLAYSGDGWDFKVIEEPIGIASAYRSCMVPIESTGTEIKMLVYLNLKTDGSTHVKELTLNYIK